MTIRFKNEFISIKEVVVNEKYINLDAVNAAINEYLQNNQISEESYYNAKASEDLTGGVRVELYRVSQDIDEDFEPDEGWESFTRDLAEKLRVRYVSVPEYYLPK